MRGWVRVAGDGETLAACRSWRIGGNEFPVEETKAHSGALLAKLQGVETREQALQLKGRTIAVARGALPGPPAGRYYFDDLIGLEVVDASGATLGRVKRISYNGAHDVMELEGERARLIPWVPAVVVNVDLASGRIEVDWGADW